MNHEEKYQNLIRALITPTSWRLTLGDAYHTVTLEDRLKCVEAGIKRFDAVFSETTVLKAAQAAAEQEIRGTGKKLQEKRLRELEKVAPKIQARIRELIQDKDPGRGFDLGYEVAAKLKAEGYSWEQVILAKRDMRDLPGNVDTGIEIGYTGRYD